MTTLCYQLTRPSQGEELEKKSRDNCECGCVPPRPLIRVRMHSSGLIDDAQQHQHHHIELPHRNPPRPLNAYRTLVHVPLDALHFYQDYINTSFSDSRRLQDTIDQLRDGTVTPSTLPPMEALHWRGKWYGMGNRRLACYKIAAEGVAPPRPQIPVLALFLPSSERMCPQGTGHTVKFGSLPTQLDGRTVEKITFPMSEECNCSQYAKMKS
eukprot:PhM_4_TR18334/c0_g4_i1/m.9238